MPNDTVPAAATGLPAANDHPDDRLWNLALETEETEHALDRAYDAERAAEDLFQYPPVPEALFLRADDPLTFPSARCRDPATGRDYFGEGAMEKIEAIAVSAPSALRREHEIARAQEIATAWRAFQAAWDAEKERCGWAAAEAVSEGISATVKELRTKLIPLRARTLDGALAKARAVVAGMGSTLSEEELARELEDNGPNVDTLATSLMLDLKNLQQPAQALAARQRDGLTDHEWHVVLESYATWLYLEMQALWTEFPHMKGMVALLYRASEYHKDAPPPSSRAVTVLDAVGCDWRADLDLGERLRGDVGGSDDR